jgi:hypothetical protein
MPCWDGARHEAVIRDETSRINGDLTYLAVSERSDEIECASETMSGAGDVLDETERRQHFRQLDRVVIVWILDVDVDVAADQDRTALQQ